VHLGELNCQLGGLCSSVKGNDHGGDSFLLKSEWQRDYLNESVIGEQKLDRWALRQWKMLLKQN
jgi:hypothetical protein